MRRRLISPFLISFLLVFLVMCTTNQKLNYLSVRDTFNMALKNYSERVKAMPASVDKDLIKSEFNPIWKDAEKALDGWGEVVKGMSEADESVAMQRYLAAKNKLIELGLKYFKEDLFNK